MKTQVEFRSSKFPPYEGEQEQINPGLWGKRLAEYFVRKLSEKGIKTEEIIAEDWGWYIPVQNEGFRLAICCGHQDGDDDEFVCFTDPSTPVVKKFFKKIDATAQLGLPRRCSRFSLRIQKSKKWYGKGRPNHELPFREV
jgi:trehalose-6-phosphatase